RQPVEEVATEHRVPGRVAQCAERVDLGLSEAQVAQPRTERSETRRHAEARLVCAVVRVTAEEMVELGGLLGDALAEVDLRHHELVEIGEQRAARRGPPLTNLLAGRHSPTTVTPAAANSDRTVGTASGYTGRVAAHTTSVANPAAAA